MQCLLISLHTLGSHVCLFNKRRHNITAVWWCWKYIYYSSHKNKTKKSEWWLWPFQSKKKKKNSRGFMWVTVPGNDLCSPSLIFFFFFLPNHKFSCCCSQEARLCGICNIWNIFNCISNHCYWSAILIWLENLFLLLSGNCTYWALHIVCVQLSQQTWKCMRTVLTHCLVVQLVRFSCTLPSHLER